jgi:CDP-glycerol glycerophosphotransferase
MVIIEADTFNIPVIATDIVGTQWMKEYGGYMVESSEEGILNGLYDFMEGKVKPLGLDYEKYNEEAIEEFYSLLNSK